MIKIVVSYILLISSFAFATEGYREIFATGKKSYETGRYSEAYTHFLKASEVAENATQKTDALLFAGHSLLNAGEYPRAREIYATVSGHAESSTDAITLAYLQKGYSFIKEGNLHAAAEEYRKVLAMEKVHVTYREEALGMLKKEWNKIYAEATEKFRAGTFADARMRFEAASLSAPDEYSRLTAIMQTAHSYYREKNYNAARALYEKIIEAGTGKPTDLSVEALLHKGYSYYLEGKNYNAARENYQQARVLRDKFLAVNRESLKYPGFDIIMESHRYHSFLKMQESFMRQWENVLLRTADSYREEKNFSSAKEIYLQIAGMNCIDIFVRATAYFRMGLVYQEEKLYNQAVESMEKALKFRIAPHQAAPIRKQLEKVKILAGDSKK